LVFDSREQFSIMIQRLALPVALVVNSFLVPVLLPAEEIKVEIRPRTDKNVAKDIQAVLELQRKYLSSQPPSGLSELANQASNFQGSTDDGSSVTVASAEQAMLQNGSPMVASCAPIVIGGGPTGSASWGRSSNSLSGMPTGRDDPEGTRRPTLAPTSQPAVHQLKLLAPPTISRIDDGIPLSSSDVMTATGQAIQRWRPVSVQSLADAESMTRPSLGAGSSSDLNAVQPAITLQPNSTDAVVGAAYQLPGGFTPPPNLAVPPGSNLAPPPSSSPVLPNATNPNILPNALGPNYVPSPSYPMAPMYQPDSRGTIMSSEPFVTGPPCQFDASYMVEPTCYMAAADVGCGSYGGPAYPPYSGIPGNIVPPTYMPNQYPGLYKGGRAGWRPLIGFGQENYNVQLGRGIIGQPVAYVPGQPFRNFLRYISP
jgi:hypothetical protein